MIDKSVREESGGKPKPLVPLVTLAKTGSLKLNGTLAEFGTGSAVD
jgi:hypothetical protein